MTGGYNWKTARTMETPGEIYGEATIQIPRAISRSFCTSSPPLVRNTSNQDSTPTKLKALQQDWPRKGTAETQRGDI